MKKERVYWLDILRVICCFCVVFIHVCSIITDKADYSTSAWVVSTILEITIRFAVPVFFMISGALFLSRDKISIKKLWKKNILNISIILLVWLPIYGVFVYTVKYNNQITSFATLKEVMKGLLSYQFQFWFLIPLLAIYVCMPMLKKISEDNKVLKYFLLLFFALKICVETIAPIIGNGDKLRLIRMLTPNMVAEYSGYFLLGYYLYKANLSKRLEKLSYFFGVLSVLVAALLTIVITNRTSTKTELFYDYFMITTFLSSVGVFNFFKYNVSKIDLKEKTKKIILIISDCTMGIYILHQIIKWTIEKFYDVYSLPFCVILTFYAPVVIIICIVLTLIIKKIPFLGKYLV